MSDHDAVEAALPWLANGTLAGAEADALERHVASCESCRRALDEHRALAYLGEGHDPAGDLEHVAPGLLVQFVAGPGTLDPEVRSWIEERLAACPACGDAAAALRQVDASLELAMLETATLDAAPAPSAARPAPAAGHTAPARWWAGLLDGFRWTVLHPAAAAAYLVVCGLLAGALVLRGGPDGGPAMRIASPLVLTTESATRGETGAGASAEVPAGRGAVLELRTELTPDDVARLRGSLDLELSEGGRTLLRQPVAPGEMDTTSGRARLLVSLDATALRGPGPYVVALRVRRPGDPLDGQALFRRMVRVSEEP